MAYLGNRPAEAYSAFQKQDFSTSATTSYTLDHPVSNQNEIALFINFVRQEPTAAYTASGTTLTLTSATASSDDMYCIYLGKAVQTVNPPSGSVGSSQLSGALVTPSTLDVNGNELILDADADTSITADTDDTVHVKTGGSDRVTINDTGLAIGTTPEAPLTVGSNNSGQQGVVGKQALFSGTSTTTYNDGNSGSWGGITLVNQDNTSNRTAVGITFVNRSTNSGVAGIQSTNDGTEQRADLRFITRGAGDVVAQRMMIDNDGNVLISKDSTSDTVTGIQTTPNGALINVFNSSGYNVMNRQADDGAFIYFKQANSNEGNISVSGTTVSYNGFTGTHWTRLADNSKPNILKGTVLETLDEMVDWYNLEFDVITKETKIDAEGNEEEVTTTDPQKIPHLLTGSQSAGDKITYNHNGTDYEATIVREADIKHMKSKVSDTTDAKNVYGVFSHWDFGDDDGINDIIVASVGSFVVRIKSGQTIAKGDLLQSNGDGTAKVQSDDNIKSSSFAKVLSTTVIETYDDGSFIVPCSLMC